jgi:electron transport complex protein RnfE
MMGVGFSLILILLGAMRELIGSGTLFDQSSLILGSLGDTLSVTVFNDYQGTLLAVLPPGAFIGLGLIVAVKNYFDLKKV